MDNNNYLVVECQRKCVRTKPWARKRTPSFLKSLETYSKQFANSKPSVSTKSISKYNSWSHYAELNYRHGNFFRNFYNVGYQRNRRLNCRKIWWQSRQNKENGFVIAVFHLIMKLRERIIICFSVTFVLFTLLLVIDFQYEIGYNGQRFFLPMRHGRVQVLETAPEGDRSVYQTFQTQYASSSATEKTKNETEDTFFDLFPFTVAHSNIPESKRVVIYIDENREAQPTLEQLVKFDDFGVNQTLQDKFHRRISKKQMYREDDALVERILNELKNRRIVHVKEKDGGTQLKLLIYYETGDMALFKPMRFPREQQTLPNHFYFTDYERHNAEIAAFHLDRILGFRRTMPVTGRLLDLKTELYQIADAELLKTFFVSPANNYCFHGHCSYYCDTSHAICGNPDKLEGSFAAFLPDKHIADRSLRKHPWRRSYHKRKKALWETEPKYCEAVKISPPFNKGTILLDLMDTAIFDFLMGNMDRHHFEVFTVFGNNSFPLHLDHGRGFGRPFHDELSILAPLTQCCIVKQSTLLKLLSFHNGEKKLSTLMRESLSKDPLTPVLWEPHYAALDRRVKIILSAIRTCIHKISSDTDEKYDSAPPSP